LAISPKSAITHTESPCCYSVTQSLGRYFDITKHPVNVCPDPLPVSLKHNDFSMTNRSNW